MSSEPSTKRTFTYRAFISYSHQDKAWGDWLHKALETWRVPPRLVGKQTAAGVIPRRLAPIFRDREELASATDLSRTVNEALAKSGALIVICSPHSARSRWVNEEVLAYKRLGRGERIFCLIVDGEPNATDIPGREADECFCPALRHRIDASGQLTSERTEPIGADARPGQDGKADAKLKLIAGLLGLGLDELRLREHQRHVRRLSLIATGALLLVLLTSSLAVTAWLARQRAERQQSQAEGLVGFMLNDLDEQMHANNKLSTLEAIGDRALAYYKSLPNRDVNDSVLAGRAKALKKIGGIQIDQGRLPEALASFHAAEKTTSQLLDREPGDVERMTRQADSMTLIGTVHWYQGDLDAALKNFQSAAEILQKAAARQPDNTDIAYALASARTNSGRVLEKRGRLDAAGKQYDEVRATFLRLHRNQPDNGRWDSELGFAYNNLGKLDWQRGLLAKSIANYQADLAIKIRLTAHDPANQNLQADLSLSHAMLGNALIRTGKLDAASVHLRKAADIGQAQVNFDPKNVSNRDIFALYSMNLGRALRLEGKLEQARVQVTRARDILLALASDNPDNAVFRQDLARARLELAKAELARNKPEAAGNQSAQAVEMSRALLADSPRDDDIHVLLARCLLLDGRAMVAQGKPELAQKRWQEARRLIEPLAQAGNSPDQLDLWASVLLLLDRREAAAKPISLLDRMGYRDPDYLRLIADSGPNRTTTHTGGPSSASGTVHHPHPQRRDNT